PCAGAECHARRIVAAELRDHTNAASLHAPLPNWLVRSHLRPGGNRELQMSVHTSFRIEHAGTGLEESSHLIGEREHRKAAPDLLRTQHLMRETVLARAPKRSSHEDAILIANHQAARLME